MMEDFDSDLGIQESTIAWMHYDFFQIKHVTDFKDFFLQPDSSNQEFHGSVQSMYLYKLIKQGGHHNHLTISDQPLHGFARAESKSAQFLCVSPIKFNLKPNFTDYEEHLHNTSIEICNALTQWRNMMTQQSETASYSDLAFNIFGSLGSEDLVLITSSDSIRCLLYAVDFIRSYSHTNQIPFIDSTTSYIVNNFAEIKKQALFDSHISISLTLNPKENNSAFVRKIHDIITNNGQKCDNTIMTILGKFDFRIFINQNQSETMHALFDFSDSPLNIRNSEYQKHVYQSRTNWLYPSKDFQDLYDHYIANHYHPKILPTKYTDETKASIDRKVKQVCNNLKQITEGSQMLSVFKHTPHLSKLIWTLFHDYSKNMYSIFSDSWKDDLHSQILAFIDIIQSLDSSGDQNLYATMEDLINAIRQTYVHVNQANRMFFEISATNLRYTGSFNKVLKTYYGIIRCIMNIGYSFHRYSNTEQSKLVPVVSFEYTPKIKTRAYGNASDVKSKKIIQFMLPYAALTDIPKYTVYLFHEVFHYIAPVDRKIRNIQYAKMCLALWLREVLKAFFTNLLKNFTPQDYTSLAEVLGDGTDINNWLEIHSSQIIEHLCRLDGQGIGTSIENDVFHSFIESTKSHNLHKLTFANLNELLKDQLLREPIRDGNSFDWCVLLLEQYIQSVMKTGTLHFDPTNIPDKDRSAYTVTYSQLFKGLMAQNKLKNFKQIFGQIRGIINFDHLEMLFDFYAFEGKEAACDFFMINALNINKYADYLYYIFQLYFDINVKLDVNEIFIKDSSMLRFGLISTIYYRKSSMLDGQGLLDFFDEITVDDLIRNKEYKTVYARNYANEFLLYFRNHLSRYLALEWQCGTITLEDCLFDLLSINDHKKHMSNAGKTECNKLHTLTLLNKPWNDTLSPSQEAFTVNMAFINQFLLYDSDYYDTRITEAQSLLLHTIPSTSAPPHTARMTVRNIQEYINAVSFGAKQIGATTDPGKNTPIWYRGESKDNYNLLPSLFRNENYKMLPRAQILGYYDLFRHHGLTSIELAGSNALNSVDIAVCMQHYGLPTHLLDWSENAMIALYFALHPEQNEMSKKEMEYSNLQNNKAVYLLNPERMNKVRAILKKLCAKNIFTEAALKKHYTLYRKELDTYPIVDLSNDHYQEVFPECYPILNKGCDKIKVTSGRSCSSCATIKSYIKDLSDSFPVASLTSLSNARIKAQFGTFTAFDLTTLYDNTPNLRAIERYKWASLNEIHNRYLQFTSTYNLDCEPFLYKITISKDNIVQMQIALARMGFTKMRLYPELERICQEAKDMINHYYE